MLMRIRRCESLSDIVEICNANIGMACHTIYQTTCQPQLLLKSRVQQSNLQAVQYQYSETGGTLTKRAITWPIV